ncbi:MAG TPA: GHMP kinase [Chloroflexota bacterium]|nr:GHMP kinase [Chloroflexota bacterium]
MSTARDCADFELIARAPLRISLAGGGTDLPAYYERYGGMVVSTTIDKFVYVHCSLNGRGQDHNAQINSADYHTFYRHHCGTPMGWEGDLALPRAALSFFGIERDISLFLASEVPPGTGLGSSSAVAVALVGAISAFLRRPLSRQQVAEMACEVELGKLLAPIGKQDQFASAYGGLNAITFSGDGVSVEPIGLTSNLLRQLERRLLLFFTGTARSSASILRDQQRASAQGEARTVEGLHRIKEFAAVCRRRLEVGDLDGIGELLDEGWRQKRGLIGGITNEWIDQIYDVAIANGAIGGKITGAGGGGFLLLYCHESKQEPLTDSMERLGLRRMDFHFEPQGMTVASVQWAAKRS